MSYECLPFNPRQVTSRQNGNNPKWEDPCHTFSATDGAPNIVCMADANANAAIDDDMSGTLKVGGEPPIIAVGYVVRRLMPIECERLQGFPDGWTDITIPEHEEIVWSKAPDEYEDPDGFDAFLDNPVTRKVKAKPASDTARYKALGNSMAVPVMKWIGERIDRIEKGES